MAGLRVPDQVRGDRLLLGGRSAGLVRRRLFVIGTALFAVASLLRGPAWIRDR
ncbi:hypothetical protein AB0L41_23320 [Amycolatopsis mediterranei]|uniref:hypothetical protein n=1 Tax=Amycolatopsis mediterranei TaxID=33910 RepID=UPI003415AD0B